MIYTFDTDDAIKYGVNEAIILNNIKYWILKNEANKSNFYDGKYWTYNSAEAFTLLFPFLTVRQIRYAIKNLEDKGAIVSGNYNTNRYDHTKWYALKDISMLQKQEIDVTNLLDHDAEIVRPYTDSKPDNKPNSKHTCMNSGEKLPHKSKTEEKKEAILQCWMSFKDKYPNIIKKHINTNCIKAKHISIPIETLSKAIENHCNIISSDLYWYNKPYIKGLQSFLDNIDIWIEPEWNHFKNQNKTTDKTGFNDLLESAKKKEVSNG